MAKRASSIGFAAELGAAAVHTGITLWWRWPIVVMAGTPWGNAAELNRMVSEKTAAALAGAIAMQAEAMKITGRAVTGKHTNDAMTALTAAAMRPSLRTVKRNAKRLGR